MLCIALVFSHCRVLGYEEALLTQHATIRRWPIDISSRPHVTATSVVESSVNFDFSFNFNKMNARKYERQKKPVNLAAAIADRLKACLANINRLSQKKSWGPVQLTPDGGKSTKRDRTMDNEAEYMTQGPWGQRRQEILPRVLPRLAMVTSTGPWIYLYRRKPHHGISIIQQCSSSTFC